MVGSIGALASRFRAITVLALGSALLLFSIAGVSGAAPQVATWYGPGFEGALTASGEVFDPNDYTAASKTLAFGTKLIVTYNGASVVVRVNDRGPYANDADLDLSRAAADAVGLTAVGVATVDVVEADPGTPTGPYSAPTPATGETGPAPSDQPAGGQYAGSQDTVGQDAGGQNGQEQYPATTTTTPGPGEADRDLPAVAPEPAKMVAVTTDRTDPGYAQGTAAEQYDETEGTDCVPGDVRSARQGACGEDTATGAGAIPAENTGTLTTSCAPNEQYCGADQAEVRKAAAVADDLVANEQEEQYTAGTTTKAQDLDTEATIKTAQEEAPQPVPPPVAEEAPQGEAAAIPPPVAVAVKEAEAERPDAPVAKAPAPQPVPVPTPAPLASAPAAPPEKERSQKPEVAVEPPPPVAVAAEKTEEPSAPVVEAPVPAPPEVAPPAPEAAPPAPEPVVVLASAPSPKQQRPEPEKIAAGSPTPVAVSAKPAPVVKSAGSEENVPNITELPRTGAPPIALPVVAGGISLGLGCLFLFLRMARR